MTPTQRAVRIRAYGGVNGIDWKVREGDVRDAFPLQLPAVLGIELAGVVEAEIAQGTLISTLSDVVGFGQIPAAIERNRTGPRIGKVVADFSR